MSRNEENVSNDGYDDDFETKGNDRQNNVKNEYLKRLNDIYREHNPAGLKDVDALVTKYVDNLHMLYLKVCTKYNVTPLPEVSLPPSIPEDGPGPTGLKRRNSKLVVNQGTKKALARCSIKLMKAPLPNMGVRFDSTELVTLDDGQVLSYNGHRVYHCQDFSMTPKDANGIEKKVYEALEQESEQFISMFNDCDWDKIPKIFSADCVTSVASRNYYGRKAAEIVFKAIRTQAGLENQGCGRTLEVKRAMFETVGHELYRENGTYSHKLQPTKHYSITWKLERNQYYIFILQW